MESNAEQDIVTLSRQKWDWMSQRQIQPPATLFHEKSVFVHMGATMTKDEELEVIASGEIHYKDIDIQETSVRFIGETTAILLNKIRLIAVVGGNEVTNPSSSPRSTSTNATSGRWPPSPSPDCSHRRRAGDQTMPGDNPSAPMPTVAPKRLISRTMCPSVAVWSVAQSLIASRRPSPS